MERHPEEDLTWENDWRWVVYIDLPSGQASWHIHDSEIVLFKGVPFFKDRKWDGHTTEDKYQRVLETANSYTAKSWEPMTLQKGAGPEWFTGDKKEDPSC